MILKLCNMKIKEFQKQLFLKRIWNPLYIRWRSRLSSGRWRRQRRSPLSISPSLDRSAFGGTRVSDLLWGTSSMSFCCNTGLVRFLRGSVKFLIFCRAWGSRVFKGLCHQSWELFWGTIFLDFVWGIRDIFCNTKRKTLTKWGLMNN